MYQTFYTTKSLAVCKTNPAISQQTLIVPATYFSDIYGLDIVHGQLLYIALMWLYLGIASKAC